MTIVATQPQIEKIRSLIERTPSQEKLSDSEIATLISRIIEAVNAPPESGLVRFFIGHKKIECPIGEILEALSSDVEEISRRGLRGVLTAPNRSVFEMCKETIASWFFESSNPERQKEYANALFSIRTAFEREFPDYVGHISALEQIPSSRGREYAFAQAALFGLSRLINHEQGRLKMGEWHGAVFRGIERALGLVPASGDFTDPALQKGLEMLRKVCHFAFTQVPLYSFPEDFVQKALRAAQLHKGPYAIPEMTPDTLVDTIREANQRLLTASTAYRGPFLPSFFKGTKNIPSVHSTQTARLGEGREKTCTVLRHVAPISNLAVYTAHLLADPGKQTLYISHDGATEPLQRLEREHPNFHFLSLPMDGPLWASLEKKSMADLKRDLGSVAPEGKQGEVSDLLERVQGVYFGRDNLTEAEKRVFILLFYSELKDLLKVSFDIDFLVSTTAGKNRGNVSLVTDMVKNMVKLGREKDPAALYELFITVLGPFVADYQGMDSARLEGALEVVQFLIHGLNEEQKRAIQEVTAYQMREERICKEERSWSEMVGPELFIACVENMRNLKESRITWKSDLTEVIVGGFCHGGTWDLDRLRKQIERDLPCILIRVNGERMVDFGQLCERLGLAAVFSSPPPPVLTAEEERGLRFLCLLQQGVTKDGIEEPVTYLNGNRAEWSVAMPNGGILSEIRKIGTRFQADPEGALKDARDRCLQDPGFSGALRSAVQFKDLPQEFSEIGDPDSIPFSMYPTEIDARIESGVFSVDVKQEMVLRHPEEKRRYPIDVFLSFKEGKATQICWGFLDNNGGALLSVG